MLQKHIGEWTTASSNININLPKGAEAGDGTHNNTATYTTQANDIVDIISEQ